MVIERRVARGILAALAIVVIVSPGVRAQPGAADLKAAFILNLARFTEWPRGVRPFGSSIILCVVGDREVANALTRTLSRRSVGGLALEARPPQEKTDLRACHVVYISATDDRTREVLATIWEAPVLTVGDSPSFTSLGGIAQLFMEGDRMRFAVNVDSVQRAKVRLSAQLLSMARIVRHDGSR